MIIPNYILFWNTTFEMASSGQSLSPLKIPTPETSCASRGLSSKGQTSKLTQENKQAIIKKIMDILDNTDLTPEERSLWENILMDVWKAPTEPS